MSPLVEEIIRWGGGIKMQSEQYMEIPLINIRRSHGHVKFILKFQNLKNNIYIETGPWCLDDI